MTASDPAPLLASADRAAERLRLAGHWEEGITLLLAVLPYAQAAGPGARGRLLTAVNRIENDRAVFTASLPLQERRALLDQALELGRAAGDRALQAEALDRLGTSLHVEALATGSRPPERELECFEEALALARAAGDERGAARTTFHIGRYHQEGLGDAASGLPFLVEARELATALDDPILLSYALRHLALTNEAAGDLAAARAGLEQSLSLRDRVGFIPAAVIARATLARLLVRLGDHAKAASLLAEARTLAQPLAMSVPA